VGLLAAVAFIVHIAGIPLKPTASVQESGSETGSEISQKTDTASEKTIQALKTMASGNPKVEPIVQNPDRYPERLLEALSRNPELLDFTLDYPDKKGTSNLDINLSGKYQPGQIPLLMQWDEDWGYAPYGDGIIALDGCGPTCLSIVAVGLTGDPALNPRALAKFSEENGYLDAKTGSTLWTLMSEGAKKLGLDSRELPLDESRMARELSLGHPIICSMRPGDFTTVGHFIVLYGYKDGAFLIRDPNSRSRSDKTWSYATLKPQIRNLWTFSV
jgi:ABC-type bacteriocin/lantibiotic exporters, contain an N-terminal double-glycine peptidase domain